MAGERQRKLTLLIHRERTVLVKRLDIFVPRELHDAGRRNVVVEKCSDGRFACTVVSFTGILEPSSSTHISGKIGNTVFAKGLLAEPDLSLRCFEWLQIEPVVRLAGFGRTASCVLRVDEHRTQQRS